MIEIDIATREDWHDVFDRSRDYDKEELARFHITKERLDKWAEGATLFVAKKDGENVAIFGRMQKRIESKSLIQAHPGIQIVFFGTEYVNTDMLRFTRLAKSFIHHTKLTFPGCPIMVFKTHYQEKAVNWLKHLGFFEHRSMGNLILMEYKECQAQ